MIARLYADEMFPRPVVVVLRTLGHDVLTTTESGKGGLGLQDEEVLAYAISDQRAVITLNRRHFIRLHRISPVHFGIVVCTDNVQFESLAQRIHAALDKLDTLEGQLVRIYRPA